jgi:hypothetical protein
MADCTAKTTIRARLFASMRGPITAAAACMALLGLAGCERWALDRQMEELCKKDGGVKVYERVTLSASYFDSAGRIKLGPAMPNDSNEPGRKSSFQRIGNDEYRIVEEVTLLKGGDPLQGEGRLRRISWQVIRTNDQQVLAEAVVYGRSGGDLIVIDHFSSKTCPPRLGGARTVLSEAFQKGRD